MRHYKHCSAVALCSGKAFWSLYKCFASVHVVCRVVPCLTMSLRGRRGLQRSRQYACASPAGAACFFFSLSHCLICKRHRRRPARVRFHFARPCLNRLTRVHASLERGKKRKKRKNRPSTKPGGCGALLPGALMPEKK